MPACSYSLGEQRQHRVEEALALDEARRSAGRGPGSRRRRRRRRRPRSARGRGRRAPARAGRARRRPGRRSRRAPGPSRRSRAGRGRSPRSPAPPAARCCATRSASSRASRAAAAAGSRRRPPARTRARAVAHARRARRRSGRLAVSVVAIVRAFYGGERVGLRSRSRRAWSRDPVQPARRPERDRGRRRPRRGACCPRTDHLHNHVGSQHAGALFSAGEAASGAAFVGAFAERLGDITPLARSAEITYLKLAKGPITATGTLGGAKDQLLESPRCRRQGRVSRRRRADRRRRRQRSLQMTVHWHVRGTLRAASRSPGALARRSRRRRAARPRRPWA